MQSGIFSTEGFITLSAEETELLNKARDLHAAIALRQDALQRQGCVRIFLRSAKGGPYEQLVGPLADFTKPTVRA